MQSLGVCLQINCVVTKDSETHWFLNWDSVFLNWDSWFFTRWVPGLTITMRNKITAKGLMWWKQSLSFSSPLKKTKGSSAHRVLTSQHIKGTGKQKLPWERIHQVIWFAMIWVISNHSSWSRPSQRNAPLVTDKKERASLKLSDPPEYHQDF